MAPASIAGDPETPSPDIDPVPPREVPRPDPGHIEPDHPDIDPGGTPPEVPQTSGETTA